MKIYIILITYFLIVLPSFSFEIDDKGLVCQYDKENKNRPNEYYWFSDGQVYKVWFDNKKSIIKKSSFPAYYKVTDDYIRFYRIFLLINTLEFTDKNNNILGICKFLKYYESIEKSIKDNLN